MLHKIDNSKKFGNNLIKILYPGQTIYKNDTGLFTIGRIDQAKIPAGALIAMHPHVNDEILTYLRYGKVKHTDSEGLSEYIEPTRLMLMKAGKSFFHEEKILDDSDTLEGLQIFIRPKEKDLKPEVVFYDLDKKYSENEWRLIASPTDTTPLQFSSDTCIYDMKLTIDHQPLKLPPIHENSSACLLYVFQGQIEVNSEIMLAKGESLLIKNETITFKTHQSAELVLFVTNENAAYYEKGMYSGNQAPHQ